MQNRLTFSDHPFTRDDLVDLDLTPAALKRAHANGAVRRLLRGVYVDAAVPDSVDLRIRAVGLAVAPGHIACDRTAAWLHGVDLLGVFDPGTAPPVEVCVLRSFGSTHRNDVRGRSRDLCAEDVEEIGGVLTTTPLRTALDLGCVLRRRDALAALDQFRSRFGLGEVELQRSATRYFRRRGVVQLRQLIPLSDPYAESARESWTRLAIIDAGLPCPVLQHEIDLDGVVIYRLDHAYPAHRVAVEYDGHEFHHTEEQVAHDEGRRTWLRQNGWFVIVVRKGDFTGQQLDRWIAQLRVALRSSYTNLRW